MRKLGTILAALWVVLLLGVQPATAQFVGGVPVAVLSTPDFSPQATLALDFTRQRYKLNGSISNNFTSLSGLTVTNSGGYGETIDGSLTWFGANTPRITNKGLLVEESRTNLLLQGSNLAAASWTIGATTSTANQANAPDGTLTAALIVPTTVATDHQITQAATTTAASYTISFYAKAAGYYKVGWREATVSGAYATFNLQTGQVISTGAGATNATITAVGNGWSRVSVTWTATAVAQTQALYVLPTAYISGDPHVGAPAGDGTSGLYVWGAQVELGAFPTSYIPTTSASVTRAADVVNFTGLSIANTVTMLGAGIPPTSQANAGRMVQINDGTNALDVAANGTSRAGDVGGQGLTLTDVGSAITYPGVTIAAISLTGGVARGSANGAAASGVAGAATVGTSTVMRVGDNSAGVRPLNGYLQQIRIYPYAANDNELQYRSAGNW